MTGKWFDPRPLEQQVAIVTGGGQGLGRGIALTLSAAGAAVVVAGRREEKLLEVSGEINSGGGRSLAVRADVTSREDLAGLVDSSLRAFGRIDVLVNNAGVQIPRVSSLELSRQDWDAVIGVNLTAVFFASQAVARIMAESGDGRIVNISSMAAENPLPGIVPYCTAKGAVMSLTKALAMDLAPYGITVNAVAPGYVPTEINAALLQDPARKRSIIERTPLRRLGSAEEIAAAVLYFCVPRAGYTTGQTLFVDGGWTLV